MYKLGWINSLPGYIILMCGTDVISIYIFIQFFENIPTSLDESAIMDGCTYFGVFFRIPVSYTHLYDFSRYEKKEGGYRIGVIASEMYMEMGTSFYWAMYQQVVYAASKSRSQTMLEILDTDMQRRDELPKLMREKMIDGLIVIGWHFKSYVENLVKRSEIPIVLLDFQIKGLKCDAVMSGNYIGMYKMTHYLLDRKSVV